MYKPDLALNKTCHKTKPNQTKQNRILTLFASNLYMYPCILSTYIFIYFILFYFIIWIYIYLFDLI